jgi:tetratricopeptide (TPR) repeat protein
MTEPNVAGAVPVVSVIVRSAGRPALPAALASIAAQDYPAIEVIVVALPGLDPASVPDTCGPHPVRLVQSGTDLSAPEAANAGLDAANGEWITFLDETDVFLPGHLSALMAARDGAPAFAVTHGCARAVLADGREVVFGQPHCLAELYERNYIHLSSALFTRALVEQGCRFDAALPVHHDWDLILQMAQHATFCFVPEPSFQWNAGAGGHGAGEGITAAYDASRQCRERVLAKWAGRRDALIERTEPLLRSAAEAAQRRDWGAATASCREVLAQSPNDPWALNLLASIQRDTDHASDARRTQLLAVSVQPRNPALAFNLALLYRAEGNLERAAFCCDRALGLDADFVPAQRLRDELARMRSAGWNPPPLQTPSFPT